MIGAVFAWAIIVLQIGATMGYAFAGNWRLATYWAAATVLNIAVTI